ncbi:MAG: cytochrome C biogenesis protein [Xanthobacteraceae bacterium]|nr:cytochrome C biogenesis protein [Xanthobacteraceae bacterium]MBV9238688.1 cytochrome C biogenesis protein [Xanthobacteraceae bacterium]MBV9630099.1 cytochrome C biogenesis protein [Xanthobacteraceae bacterium]
MGSRQIGAVGLGVAAFLIAAHAHAADGSAWDGDARSAVRLIAGNTQSVGDAPLRAGIEIRLAPGWKTYWRYPGDSGVPPRFDFAGSTNVERATVEWPTPHRFDDGGGQSIGYSKGVVLPVQVQAKDATKPVTLRLKLEYAICEKLCVPAEASLELPLAAGAESSTNETLAAAESRVPKPASVGDSALLAVRSVHEEPGARFTRVIVDVAAPAGEQVDLFAEGPSPEWALPVPMPIAGAPSGLQRFAFDLDGLPPGADPHGAVLTLTAAAGRSAIEVKTKLE